MKKILTLNDDIVFVFQTQQLLQVTSVYAAWDVNLDAYKTVAYDEYNEILSYGTDQYFFSSARFDSIITGTAYQEMTYLEYKRYHQDLLANMYPDAPILTAIDDTPSGRHNSILQNLSDKGINVKIIR